MKILFSLESSNWVIPGNVLDFEYNILTEPKEAYII